MGREGSSNRPLYSKMLQDDGYATPRYMITVDEGWRIWILCENMYESIADQLLERLRAYPQEWDY